MAHVFVIIIPIMFVKLRKCWRMLYSAVSLGTPENSAIQKLSVTIINTSDFPRRKPGKGAMLHGGTSSSTLMIFQDASLGRN